MTEFERALRKFVRAGHDLCAVWGDADEVAPLSEDIRPPLSLDEWLDELLAHYEGTEVTS